MLWKPHRHLSETHANSSRLLRKSKASSRELLATIVSKQFVLDFCHYKSPWIPDDSVASSIHSRAWTLPLLAQQVCDCCNLFSRDSCSWSKHISSCAMTGVNTVPYEGLLWLGETPLPYSLSCLCKWAVDSAYEVSGRQLPVLLLGVTTLDQLKGSSQVVFSWWFLSFIICGMSW